MTTKTETALEFCQRTLAGFKDKADHNKNETLNCFRIVMIASLLAPLFVTLGEGLWLGKVIPSLLSITAAFGTAWLQLRKPQQLWAVYRTCQRKLEDHLSKFTYKIGEYGQTKTPDTLLAENVAAIGWEAHEKWLPNVPDPELLKEPDK